MFQRNTLAPLGAIKAEGQPSLLWNMVSGHSVCGCFSYCHESVIIPKDTNKAAIELIKLEHSKFFKTHFHSYSRDMFKYEQVVLFEVSRISLEYITEKSPLIKNIFFSVLLDSAFYLLSIFFISEDVLFPFT